MSVTLKLEDAKFTEALRKLQKKVKIDGVRVVKNEAGLFVNDVMNKTPPHGKSQASMKRGERTIGKEMGFIIVGRDIGWLQHMQDTFGAPVNTPLKRKDGTVYVVDIDHITFTHSQVRNFHRRMRSKSSGKIARAHSKQNTKNIGRHTSHERMWTTNKIKSDVIKEKQAKVGLAKSGWNTALTALKRPIPKWIKRHGFGHSGYSENGKTGNKFVLTMTNRLIYIPSYQKRFVDPALKTRVRAMTTHLKKVIEKGAGAYRLKKGI